MGCCSSLPDREEDSQHNRNTSAETNNNNIQTQQLKKPEVTVTKAFSSLHSANAEKSVDKLGTSSVHDGSSINNSSTWPIFVRLSNNGQDITIQVPIEPPYLTVSGLRKELLPHLENHTSSTRVIFIYLGRVLPDKHVIVPTVTNDPDQPLPPTKNSEIHIQKQGVIQAMITTTSK